MIQSKYLVNFIEHQLEKYLISSPYTKQKNAKRIQLFFFCNLSIFTAIVSLFLSVLINNK